MHWDDLRHDRPYEENQRKLEIAQEYGQTGKAKPDGAVLKFATEKQKLRYYNA